MDLAAFWRGGAWLAALDRRTNVNPSTQNAPGRHDGSSPDVLGELDRPPRVSDVIFEIISFQIFAFRLPIRSDQHQHQTVS